jgi:hypothetical protein
VTEEALAILIADALADAGYYTETREDGRVEVTTLTETFLVTIMPKTRNVPIEVPIEVQVKDELEELENHLEEAGGSVVKYEYVPVFTNVNEEGECYDRHDSLEDAMAVLMDFPNDLIEVRLTLNGKPPPKRITRKFMARYMRMRAGLLS